MPFKFLKKYQKDISETFNLSLPILFGRLGAVLMGVLDNIMIGKIGYEPLAASGIATSIYILIAIIPIGMIIVGSPMISGFNSREDKQGAVDTLKSCIQVSQLVSFAFAIVLCVIALNFHLLGQEPIVTELALPLFYLLILSTFPLMYFIAVEQFTDGLGNTGISMFFNVSALFVNAGINYCLIYGNFGFPELGLLGAGIGTLIARTYMAIGIWCYVRYSKQFSEYALNFNQLQIHWESFKQVLKTGLPSGFQFFFEISAFSFATIAVGWLGTVQLAAHNVIISIASITYMVSSGFAAGSSIRVGYASGTHDVKAVLNAAKSGMILVCSLILVFSIALIIFNKYFIILYNEDVEVVAIASGLMLLLAVFQFADGINVVAVAILRAISDVNVPALLTMGCFWALGIPMGLLFSFYFHLDVYGIWLGLLIGQGISSIILTWRFFHKARKM
ncbi:MAG: MATE family efflux transporter [Bacteroidota bacterium]|nr:MATE family efflux transporter [Bacteroidota bacterium]